MTYVSIEGLDCSGKTTNMLFIMKELEKRGISVTTTREPGGTEFNEELRTLVKNPKYRLEPMTELLIFYAARIETIEKVLKANVYDVVLSDRGFHSTFAYQGALAGDAFMDKLLKLHNLCLGTFSPDLTILLDLDISAYERRKNVRGEELDAIENKGQAYLQKVINNYRDIARNLHYVHSIDASKDLPEVQQSLLPLIDKIEKLVLNKSGCKVA